MVEMTTEKETKDQIGSENTMKSIIYTAPG